MTEYSPLPPRGYMCSLSTFKVTTFCHVDIVVNGTRKVRTMASNHYDAGPHLAVLTLLKQDRVWVKRYSGQGYYSNGPMTTFSGFLIG